MIAARILLCCALLLSFPSVAQGTGPEARTAIAAQIMAPVRARLPETLQRIRTTGVDRMIAAMARQQPDWTAQNRQQIETILLRWAEDHLVDLYDSLENAFADWFPSEVLRTVRAKAQRQDDFRLEDLAEFVEFRRRRTDIRDIFKAAEVRRTQNFSDRVLPELVALGYRPSKGQ